jgi:hypothetical protein
VLLALACAGPPAAEEPPLPAPAPPPQEGAGAERGAALEAYPRFPMHVTRVYELIVEFPSPTWASTPEEATRSHFNREQDGPKFRMEQVPGDESPADWKRLYAIHALYARNGRFESFRTLSLYEWAKLCGKGKLAVQSIHEEELHWLVLVVCESTALGPGAEGWGEGVGAVTLMDVQRLSDTYVRVHHTWRGQRFEREDLSSWPVTEQQIREMADRFARIRLSLAPNAE